MMLLGVGGDSGEYGSAFEVILKQRPQASPTELPPNANALTAAEKPPNVRPHAVKGRRGQPGLHGVLYYKNKRRAYRERRSQNTA